MSLDIDGESLGVPSLHENGPRSSKLADQAFTGSNARYDTPAAHTLHNIFAVPGDEMAVVDNVFLVRLQLRKLSSCMIDFIQVLEREDYSHPSGEWRQNLLST